MTYTLKIYLIGKWFPVVEKFVGDEGLFALRQRIRNLSDNPVIQDEGRQLWRAVRWFKVTEHGD